jgi:Icc-related predicted phosphoesterase
MKNKLNVLHISDTHNYHSLLTIPKNIDVIIHSGDTTNYYDKVKNWVEFQNFFEWYKNLDIPYKILIAGNHDATLYHNTMNIKQQLKDSGIIYLENDYCDIEGIKIFGTPITPTFNNWYFMKQRSKLDNVWSNVDDNIDIFVSHGPCKGILDLSEDINHNLEYCGDKALYRHITSRIKPKLFLHGHIHSNKNIENTGIYYKDKIYFSNAASMMDNKFGILHCNGNKFSISLKNKKVSIL